MPGRLFERKGSGLIIALGVLAMLSIMATTFVTLMRLDTRVTANYVDDLRCEMLANGMLNYFKGLLRDDLDRTWGKYENRDSGVGAVGWTWSASGGTIATVIPGLETSQYGTPICNDFWFNPPYTEWTHWGGLFTGEFEESGVHQQSFAGGTSYSHGVVARYHDADHSRDFDMWVGRTLVKRAADGTILHVSHPTGGVEMDFDGDGDPSPPCNGNSGAFWEEENSDTRWYYDTAPFVLFSGQTYFYPGTTITGEQALGGGTFWRWAVKLGVAHGSYLNLNTAGNLLGKNTSYLNNIGGLNLRAQRAVDEATTQIDTQHLGRLQWKGFAGEFEYNRGGFPMFYDEIGDHPSQVSLEKLFKIDTYAGLDVPGWLLRSMGDLDLDRQKARQLIAYRLGPNGAPGDGSDRYKPGWRQDGATYYRCASPENPLGDDRFFGVNDVIEHDRSVDHPWTSAIASILEDEEWRKLRPYVTMWSTDTILRGKIWPGEGNSYPGDWRHIDILKRVNINMIGARGPDGLPHEDAALKSRWAAKREREQNRLYYMLVAGMQFANRPNPEQTACQFIASLCDMVDRDRDETYYAAPTGTAWAVGVEKHPVINEVVIFIRNANSSSYEPRWLRFELYNPMENIPWIPDALEGYDISEYRLEINGNYWRLGDLWVFSHDDFQTKQHKVGTIGADGLYGYPGDGTAEKKSWSRYVHIGWETDWPIQVTKTDLVNGLNVKLWKPLHGTAALNVPVSAEKVEMVLGQKCICVDRTPLMKMMPPLTSGGGPGGSERNFTGCYRRWDPQNAKIYGTPTDEKSNLVWVPGWGPAVFATLGKPNVGYPEKVPPNDYYNAKPS
ncbi:MAG: hypothetical protein AMK75_06105, partial [Planctomycetes bacterium SM23_65]